MVTFHISKLGYLICIFSVNKSGTGGKGKKRKLTGDSEPKKGNV